MRRNTKRKSHKIGAVVALLFAVLIYIFIANNITFISHVTLPSFSSITHNVASADHDWNLILVNSSNYIPDDYEVELTELSNGEKVDSRIYPELQGMFNAARAEG